MVSRAENEALVRVGPGDGHGLPHAKEHLVAADLAVVRVRRRLLEAVAMIKEGKPALGSDIAGLTAVAAPDVDVPVGTEWRALAPFHRELAKTG